MSAETIVPQLPTLYHPKAVRSGMTAYVNYSENTGSALQLVLEGLDDGNRPCRISLPAATIVALAALCAATLPEGERY